MVGSWYDFLVHQKDQFWRGILYYALGLATLSYAVIALSAWNLLKPQFIWGMLFLFFLIRFHKLQAWFQWLREVGKDLRFGGDLPSKLLFGVFTITFIGLLLGALTPELGGDALCYQLNLPKVFLKAGSVAPDPLDYNSYFPLFMNNLYLIGLATGGVFSAKLFHFICGFLLFLSVKSALFKETSSYALSMFLALVLMLTPAIYNLISTTYVDVGVAFYVFLSFVVFSEGVLSGNFRPFLLSGVLAGCAVAIKYLALLSVVGIFCVGIYAVFVSRRFKRSAAEALFFIVGILIAAGYWLGRNWIATGNPVFPYLGSFFKGMTPLSMVPPQFGVGRSFYDLISLYFNMFFIPDSFGAFTTRIGIFYFLLLPFLFLAVIFVPRARIYGIFILAFTVQLFFLAQVDRYAISVLPMIAVGGGAGVHWLYQRYFSKSRKTVLIVKVISIALLLYYLLAGIFHYRYAYFLATGKWSPEQYRAALERTTGAADWINRNLSGDARIFFEGENRLFYFDRPVLRQCFLEWRLNLPDLSLDSTEVSKDPESLKRLLRQYGVTHILSSRPISGAQLTTGAVPVSKRLLTASLAREIYSASSSNVRETRFLYSLFEIK